MRYVVFFVLFFLIFFVAESVHAAGRLVKSDLNDTVYYVDDVGQRHAFPNIVTYQSWFGDDFSTIETLSGEALASMRLGRNIVVRPGKFLLKVPSSPEVYAVEPGGVLRHIMNDTVAKQIFGTNWERKVRDLPEVFFTNYSIGEPIQFSHQIPDGVVYQIEGESTLYWKNKGILQSFSSESDIRENGYTKSDVILGDLRNFYSRVLPVSGKSDHVFNPVFAPNTPSASCRTDQMTAAVIFVTEDDSVSGEELAVLNTVMTRLPETFSESTSGLSRITVDPELSILVDRNQRLTQLNEEGVRVMNLEEVALSFYDTSADEYDFLIVFNDFLGPAFNNESASYTMVNNDFHGTNRILLDRSKFFGSQGRLKGVVHMNNVDQYSVSGEPFVVSMMDLLHHEILHQWGASVSFIDEAGNRSFDLLSEDQGHWSKWVTHLSPLGGWGWVDQGNGVLVSGHVTRDPNTVLSLPDIDLYLMGLLPARAIGPIRYIVPENGSEDLENAAGTLSEVRIDQIIEAHGFWKCELD